MPVLPQGDDAMDVDRAKRAAAQAAAAWVEDGMTVGLGTGSTVRWLLEALGKRVAAGLAIRGVATSHATEARARDLGIPMVPLDQAGQLDLTIDGADEVSPALDLIKGGGGALLREKLVALASRRRVVIVDRGKLVARLGRGSVPVEVVVFGWPQTVQRIAALGADARLRLNRAGRPFVSDEGHHVLDCAFGPIDHPGELARRLKLLPGVVESGLFVGMTETLVVGHDNGTVEVRTADAASPPARPG